MTADDNKVFQLRHDYMSCLKIASETDSKTEDQILRKEAIVLLEELQKLCQHNYTVILKSQYKESYPSAYEDSYTTPQKRICLCCGVFESAFDNRFIKLTTNPFVRFEDNCPNQIKNPLSYLLTEVVCLAEEKGFGVYSSQLKKE